MSTQSVELVKPAGTIIVVFGEATYTLRLPILGEFRQFRVEAAALWDGLSELEADVKVKQFEERIVAWWRHVFDVLATPLPADEDQWPIWFTDGGFVNEVVKHWRAVPLVRGTTA